ncbi:hypothetical protein AcV7_003747 [Taiwanofungus camphoratus]|nr:hypothetical protein AcV7_003747 [Antrodia cinnamomea]
MSEPNHAARRGTWRMRLAGLSKRSLLLAEKQRGARTGLRIALSRKGGLRPRAAGLSACTSMHHHPMQRQRGDTHLPVVARDIRSAESWQPADPRYTGRTGEIEWQPGSASAICDKPRRLPCWARGVIDLRVGSCMRLRLRLHLHPRTGQRGRANEARAQTHARGSIRPGTTALDVCRRASQPRSRAVRGPGDNKWRSPCSAGERMSRRAGNARHAIGRQGGRSVGEADGFAKHRYLSLVSYGGRIGRAASNARGAEG